MSVSEDQLNLCVNQLELLISITCSDFMSYKGEEQVHMTCSSQKLARNTVVE
jgi:hypothetical protein